MLRHLVLTILSIGILTADQMASHIKARSRTARSTRPTWPIQCPYISMINQDKTWYMYRPILDCCYRCRNPYHGCIKKDTPHWFCYREAFTCSSNCIVKSHWHGENFPKSAHEIMQNFPLNSYFSRKAPAGSKGQHHDRKPFPARRAKLPCVGRVCLGELCFPTQLCFRVFPRYLKNVPL